MATDPSGLAENGPFRKGILGKVSNPHMRELESNYDAAVIAGRKDEAKMILEAAHDYASLQTGLHPDHDKFEAKNKGIRDFRHGTIVGKTIDGMTEGKEIAVDLWLMSQKKAYVEENYLVEVAPGLYERPRIFSPRERPYAEREAAELQLDVTVSAFTLMAGMPPVVGAERTAGTIFTVQNDISKIAQSRRVWGQTEGSVYGMRVSDAPIWRSWRNAKTRDPGQVIFVDDAAELFSPHEITGPFSGLKNLLGQQKAGFGDILIEDSYRIGNDIYVLNAIIGEHGPGQSAGFALLRLQTRRLVDKSLNVGGAGTAGGYTILCGEGLIGQ